MTDSTTPLVATALGLLVCAAGCERGGTPEAARPRSPKPIKVAAAEAPPSEVVRAYPGVVQANDSVSLSFEQAGRLVEFPVDEGQSLEAGDLIGRLDPRDFQNQVDAAEARLTAAESRLERLSQALEKHAVGEMDVIEQRATRDAARARLNIAKKALADTEIRAPYDGVVADKLVDSFDEVDAGRGVVLFQSDDDIEIHITIPEQALVHADASDPGAFVATFDALPGESYALAFKEVATQGDAITQTYRVSLTMPAPRGANVLPGMTAEVSWSRPSRASRDAGVMIPSGAAFASPDGDAHVWVVDPESMVVSQRRVRLGSLAGESRVSVLEGLESGELVAAAGVHHLREGARVRPLGGPTTTTQRR